MSRATNQSFLLGTLPVFAGLHDEHLRALAAQLHPQTFERGEIIFHQGSLGSTLYVVVSGRARIFTVNEAGQELSLLICRAGDFFGELSLLDDLPRSASVAAMSRTTTLTLHRSAFLSVINAHPPIAVAVLKALSLRLRNSTLYAEHLANRSASQRIVRQLLELMGRYGVCIDGATMIDLRLTQDELASLTGTTRETVNRVLSTLRANGVLRVERARISILDRARLEGLRDG